MARDVHEVEGGRTKKLDLWCVEKAIMVFTDEAGIFNGLLSQFSHVGLSTDDAYIVGMPGACLICESDVLAYEHSYANARHVEAVEEGLDGRVDLHALPLALVFIYSLSDGGDDAIMPSLYSFQCARKSFVVVGEFWWPIVAVVYMSKVTS